MCELFDSPASLYAYLISREPVESGRRHLCTTPMGGADSFAPPCPSHLLEVGPFDMCKSLLRALGFLVAFSMAPLRPSPTPKSRLVSLTISWPDDSNHRPHEPLR